MEIRDYKKYIGIPFKNLGRDFDGCDCWGLVKLFYTNELGIELPEYYLDCDDTCGIAETVEREISYKWVKENSPAWGRVVTFKGLLPDTPIMITHVGVAINSDFFLHTTNSGNSCLVRTNRGLWASKIEGYYTWKK